MEHKLYLSEIFFGLQGEGSRMGFPSIFIRIGGCNFDCSNFNCKIKSPLDGSILTGCDSIYAANTKHFKHTWSKYTNYKDIIDECECVLPNNIAYNEELEDIIFTGGEPLLYHRNPILISLVEHYISRGHKVWFETNGSIDVDFRKYEIYKKVSFSISVKMSSSGVEKEKRWKPEVVNEYLKNTQDSYFKFVLSKNSIKEEGNEIFEYLNMIPTYGVVYLMPLGVDQEELIYNAKTVYQFAADNGLRYSDRLQIRIHDSLRGV